MTGIELLVSMICLNMTTCSDGGQLEFVSSGYEQKAIKVQAAKDNLNGRHLIIGTIQNYPLSYAERTSNGTLIGKGVAFEFINLLKDTFNFTYSVVVPKENWEGSKTYLDNSLIGMVNRQEVDIAAAFLPRLTDSASLIRYSVSLDEGVWVLLLKRPSESANGSGLLAPFDNDVWYLILVAVLTFGPFIYLMTWVRYLLTKDNNNKPYTLSPCVWFVYGAFIKQGTTLAPDANTTRVLFATWWIFITLLSAFYTANLTAFLTLSKFTLAINKPDDLLKKNSKWIARKGSAVEYVVKNPEEDLYTLNKMVLKNRALFQSEEYDAPFLSFVKDDYVYVRDKPAIEHLMYDDYKNKTRLGVEEKNRCAYVVAENAFMKKSRAFAFPSNSSYADLFDPILLSLVESGIVKYKSRYDLPGNVICPLNLKSTERRLRNGDLSMTYLLAAYGIAIASAVFIFEVIYRYWIQRCMKPLISKKNNDDDITKIPTNNYGKISPGPPPYQSIFGLTYEPESKNSTRQTINGRDYWVVRMPGGDTRLIPVRSPSAFLFQYST